MNLPLFYLALAAVSFAVTVLFMPVAQTLGRRMQAWDVPDELSHQNHVFHIARTGGIALAAGTYSGFLLMMAVDHHQFMGRALAGAMVGGGLAFVTGLLDDLHEIKPWVKAVLLAAAAIAGVSIFPHVDITGWVRLDFLLAVFWLLGLSNASNLMDGMDGLAAGMAAAATLGLLAVSLALEAPFGQGFKLVLIGACLGFLVFNRPPARIFMGDCGSLMIGIHLGGLSLSTVKSGSQAIIPVLLVMSPLLLDTFLAMLRRLLRGDDLFTGDRSHIYDIIHRQWFSVWQVVSRMWALGLAFSALGLAACFLPPLWQAALLAGSWLLVIFSMVRRGMFGPEPPSNRKERLWDREPPE